MKELNKKIIELISDYIEQYPEQRFGQIIFNLDINQFVKSKEYEPKTRDIYYDSSKEILDRIEKRINLLNKE